MAPTALLNWDDAAAYLGTTVRHMKTLTYANRLEYVKIGGKVRFRTRALDLFIERSTVKAVDA